MLVSGVQQSDTVICTQVSIDTVTHTHVSILLQILFPFRLRQYFFLFITVIFILEIVHNEERKDQIQDRMKKEKQDSISYHRSHLSLWPHRVAPTAFRPVYAKCSSPDSLLLGLVLFYQSSLGKIYLTARPASDVRGVVVAGECMGTKPSFVTS